MPPIDLIDELIGDLADTTVPRSAALMKARALRCRLAADAGARADEPPEPDDLPARGSITLPIDRAEWRAAWAIALPDGWYVSDDSYAPPFVGKTRDPAEARLFPSGPAAAARALPPVDLSGVASEA